MTFYRSFLDNISIIPPEKNGGIILDLDESLVHSFDDMDTLRSLHIYDDSNLIDIRNRTYIITLDDVINTGRSGIKTQLWGITRPYLKEF